MIKRLLKFSCLLAFMLINANIFSQISQGGVPFSFTKEGATQLKSAIQTVTMPLVNVGTLNAEDLVNDLRKDIPWRFGYRMNVDYNNHNSGTWDYLADGSKLWRLRIYSKGALTLNLIFNDYEIPAGAKLFIYNQDHSDVIGAFTDFNNQADHVFATTLVKGDAVTLEYYEPANAAFEGKLSLTSVTHGYRSADDYAEKSFGDAGSCQVNVACTTVSSGWENEIRSVCMLVTSGSGFCTGTLINNTSNNGTPYVLTANHCYSSPSSWVFWFNWQSSTCTNPSSSPSYNSISGATLKARSTTSDFCLVQMNSTPPCTYNVYYAGWSRTTTAPTSGMCIHHPNGDIKKITVAGTFSIYDNYDAGNGAADCWKVLWPTTACTEPGSSGSPIFDSNHLVVGQLYGGPSSCGASSSSMNDYFGRFHVSWDGDGTSSSRLKDWLDPTSLDPTTLQGYDPCAVTTSLDAELNAVTVPTTSYCSTQSIIPTVVIKNIGTTTLTSLVVRYNIDGGTNVSQNWTGSLATSATATVTFPSITLTSGSHTFNASCTSPNGGTDENTANDTKAVTYTVSTGQSLPFTEGFENTTFPPTDWTINNPDASTTWARKTTSGNGTSTASAYIDFYNYNSAGQTDELITPAISLPSGTIQMTFNVAYRQYNSSYSDGLQIYISTDCGVTYNSTAIYDKSGSTLATTTASTSAFTPSTSAQWRMETIDLSAYAGNSVKLKFVGVNAYGNNLYIDDINIQSVGSAPVASFTGTPITLCAGETVTFSDASTNTPTSWLWTFTGGTPSTSTSQNPTVTYSTAGTYDVTLVATNGSGSDSETMTGYVTVNSSSAASVSIAASQTSICSGVSVTFTATPTNGGSAPTYQWKVNGNTVGTSSPTYTSSTLVNNDVVTCVMTSNSACVTGSPTVTSNTVTMTVNTAVTPSVSVAASSTNVCTGTSVTFTATPTNGGTPTYQWILNGSNVGTNSATYTNSSLANGNTVSCVMTSNLACASPTTATSNTVTMTVNSSVTPSVQISASNTNICSGESVIFTATPSNGGTTPSYQWQVNGSNVGTNSVSYTTTNLNNNDVVTCVLTSSEACASLSSVNSNSITMNVSSSSVSASYTYSQNQLDFTFTNTSTGATSYLWDFGDGTTSTLVDPTHSYANSGVYVITLTAYGACGSNQVMQSVNAVGSSILNNSNAFAVGIYPNPSKDITNVEISGYKTMDGEVIVSDMVGKQLYNCRFDNVSGSANLKIDLSNYEQGVYYFTIRLDKQKQVFKVIKK